MYTLFLVASSIHATHLVARNCSVGFVVQEPGLERKSLERKIGRTFSVLGGNLPGLEQGSFGKGVFPSEKSIF